MARVNGTNVRAIRPYLRRTNPDAVNQATTGKAGLLHVAEAGSVTGKNWPQNVFTDIPIIEASFWLTVAGTAR